VATRRHQRVADGLVCVHALWEFLSARVWLVRVLAKNVWVPTVACFVAGFDSMLGAESEKPGSVVITALPGVPVALVL
jgi:hypothetical protein